MLRDLNKTIFLRIEALLPLLSLLARSVFATSLLIYFWTAGVTKLWPGVLSVIGDGSRFVNGINVRTGVGVSKEKRDAETRVGRPPLLLAGNAPDRLHGTSLGRF